MMTTEWRQEFSSGLALKGIVQEATAALIRMDAERLEEMALCCADLNRELPRLSPAEVVAVLGTDFRDAQSDLNLMDRVLLETRANLAVLSSIRAIRLRAAGRLAGYAVQSKLDWRGLKEEPVYGDD